jgi:uncharacterized membrane protein
MGPVLMFAGTMFVILLFILAIVFGVGMVGTILDREKRKSPEDQLAGRFARGEIGEAEYLRGLAILRHGPDLEAYAAEIEGARLLRDTRTTDT